VLWQHNVGSPISGYPVVYAVGGKEYVAVTTGSSGVYNNGKRFAPEVMPEKADSAVFVFALP
jgi:alcohol dehydrogenase (cytochrome c)